MSLLPTLIFTLVLAQLLHEPFHIPDALYGGLLVYAFVNMLLPSLLPRVGVADDTTRRRSPWLLALSGHYGSVGKAMRMPTSSLPMIPMSA